MDILGCFSRNKMCSVTVRLEVLTRDMKYTCFIAAKKTCKSGIKYAE